MDARRWKTDIFDELVVDLLVTGVVAEAEAAAVEVEDLVTWLVPSQLNRVTVSEMFVELLLPLTVLVTRRTIVFFVLVEVDDGPTSDS